MNQLPSFQEFLTGQGVEIPVWGFVLNLLLAALLSWILSRIYVRFGTALSNRRFFGRNFVPITMTTMLIISVVKSSLALSLGLVGALSIVRFRAAIKEPEELAYLFLAIAIGLGLGADQRLITIVAFVLIGGAIVLRGIRHQGERNENLHLTVASHNPEKVPLETIVETLRRHAVAAELKRYDETGELLEASFQVEFRDFAALNRAKNDLFALGESVTVSFLDSKGAY